MRREFGDRVLCLDDVAAGAREQPGGPPRPHAAGVELSEGKIGARRLPGPRGHELPGEGPIESVGRVARVQSAAAVFVSVPDVPRSRRRWRGGLGSDIAPPDRSIRDAGRSCSSRSRANERGASRAERAAQLGIGEQRRDLAGQRRGIVDVHEPGAAGRRRAAPRIPRSASRRSAARPPSPRAARSRSSRRRAPASRRCRPPDSRPAARRPGPGRRRWRRRPRHAPPPRAPRDRVRRQQSRVARRARAAERSSSRGSGDRRLSAARAAPRTARNDDAVRHRRRPRGRLPESIHVDPVRHDLVVAGEVARDGASRGVGDRQAGADAPHQRREQPAVRAIPAMPLLAVRVERGDDRRRWPGRRTNHGTSGISGSCMWSTSNRAVRNSSATRHHDRGSTPMPVSVPPMTSDTQPLSASSPSAEGRR